MSAAYECWICGYQLLARDDVTARLVCCGAVYLIKPTCADENECARRQRDQVPGVTPLQGTNDFDLTK